MEQLDLAMFDRLMPSDFALLEQLRRSDRGRVVIIHGLLKYLELWRTSAWVDHEVIFMSVFDAVNYVCKYHPPFRMELKDRLLDQPMSDAIETALSALAQPAQPADYNSCDIESDIRESDIRLRA
jgi:hypothetical protein